MDIAYDHITEETYTSDRSPTPTPQKTGALSQPKSDLNTEFQETFKAFSNSPWGSKLGGLWGNVRKQGEQYYEDARREVGEVGGEALKGISDLRETIVKKTGDLMLDEEQTNAKGGSSKSDKAPAGVDEHISSSDEAQTESEITRDPDGLISRFRSEATKRLKDLEKAEDAADEALLRFGTNLRNFFRDAVAIAPPSEDGSITQGSVMFESKDSSGKRVIHTTRFDAQLHVIHSALGSFTQDPVSERWASFKTEFDVDAKTSEISRDLERYSDLRRASDELVPEKVSYRDFWCRYYFLRLVIETEEQRRKELLKGASQSGAEEEVSWDADSDSDSESRKAVKATTSPSRPSTSHTITLKSTDETGSTTTLSPTPQPPTASSSLTSKPQEGRRSNDQQSQPDSDASYDLVSGTTSKSPGSPKENKEKEKSRAGGQDEDGSDEDWE